jgi:hypothetical protein
MPQDMAYLWQVFGELKTPGVDVTFSEIKSYCQMTGERLNSIDTRLLRKLDFLYKAEFNHG